MRILSLFSGIGAFEKALSNLKVSFSLVNYCEIDKYASKAYSIIHGVDEIKNLGDITNVDAQTLQDFDIMTWGFPCQDISVAGKQSGIEIGTRSGLYYEGLRILKAKLPKYSIIENVKNLTGKKFKAQFASILQDLEQLGYTNYWKVLNAKDYGIPQNRERVFIISIRGDHKPYEFPKPFDNGLRLKDMLEDEVDEKYYINSEKVEKLLSKLTSHNQEICYCIDANYYKGTTPEQFLNKKRRQLCAVLKLDRDFSHSICASIGRTTEREFFKKNQGQLVGEVIPCLTPDSPKVLQKIGSIGSDSQANSMYSTDGIAAAQCGEAGGLGARTGLYMVKEATKQGFAIATEGDSINIQFPNSETRRGRVGRECAQTIETACNQATIIKVDVPQSVKVRKHEVDVLGLQQLLRNSKTISNREISEKLQKPSTMVEHWFRTDKCFSIPDADIWFKLKDLLGIETNNFDSQIMEFEEREGVFEKSNRCYLDGGISPTLTSTNADEKVITNYRIRKLTPKECWRLMGFEDTDIDKCTLAGISNTQLYKMAGNSIVVNVLERIFENLLEGGAK